MYKGNTKQLTNAIQRIAKWKLMFVNNAKINIKNFIYLPLPRWEGSSKTGTLFNTYVKYMNTYIIIRANGLGTPIGSSEGGGWIGGNGWLASPLTY